jgi:hypothetical protein
VHIYSPIPTIYSWHEVPKLTPMLMMPMPMLMLMLMMLTMGLHSQL